MENDNAIIINGTRYDAVPSDRPLKRCYGCALRLECFNVGKLCEIFGDRYNPVYFKVKKEDEHGS